MSWGGVGRVLWYIVYPLIWILETICIVLLVILSPVVHLLQYTGHILLFPVRVLAKFETLYIYFGTAVLLGLLTGGVLFYTAQILNPLLGVDGNSTPGRTVASYRAERAEKEALRAREHARYGLSGNKASRPLESILKLEDSDWAAGQNLGPPTPMMGTMILEEDTSSE